MTENEKISLCIALLDDDDGICEAGYNTLVDLDLVPERVRLVVKAVDGRFYINPTGSVRVGRIERKST